MVDKLQCARRGATTAAGWLAGVAGLILLTLLGLNVVTRLFEINLVWIAETSRVVFLWGVAFGMIAVSLGGLHFRVNLFNLAATQNAEPTDLWEIVTQLLACAVLAYILYFAVPSIARAATQAFASIPLTYGTMRLAFTVGVAGMLVAHVWRVLELLLMRLSRTSSKVME